VQEQPTDETPEQTLERELLAAQAQIRDVGSVLREALAEDDRLAALGATPQGEAPQRESGPGETPQGEAGQR
jgi:hypothetical protein